MMRCVQNFSRKTGSEESNWEVEIRWDDNIKVDLKGIECEGVDRVHVAQDRFQLRALFTTVMKLRVP